MPSTLRDFEEYERQVDNRAEPSIEMPDLPNPNECRELRGKGDTCIWRRMDGDSDSWDTICGNAWRLETGTPTENKMRYCPFCGRHLVEE